MRPAGLPYSAAAAETGMPVNLRRRERPGLETGRPSNSALRRLSAPLRMSGNVKGFRMPAGHRIVGLHGGRRPKSLEGGNRGRSSHRR